MKWRQKRQLLIALFVIGPIIITLSLWWFLSRPEPTCFDGAQNQNEQGIDCGGICVNSCQEEIPNPVVSWTRVFQLSGDVYNAVARVEMPEEGLIAEDVPYIFRTYDSEGLLISEEENYIDIPPSRTIAVFNSSIQPGDRNPARATIEFSEEIEWGRVSRDSIQFNLIGQPQVNDGSFGTSIRVMVGHDGNQTLYDVSIAIVIFDTAGNAVHSSQTFLEELSIGESESLTFTWPIALSASMDTVSIFPVSYSLSQ